MQAVVAHVSIDKHTLHNFNILIVGCLGSATKTYEMTPF